MKMNITTFFLKSSMIQTMIDWWVTEKIKKKGNILRRPENIEEGQNKIRPLSDRQFYQKIDYA